MVRRILMGTLVAATLALTASPAVLAHGAEPSHAPHVLACGVTVGGGTC